jgi:23S rRNA (cytosine1962-C5)-methyltransferase
VYRSDLLSGPDLPPGAVVEVGDEKGRFLGTALYSNASQIAIRMISSQSAIDPSALLRERIQDAAAYRRRVVRDTDSYRLVFSEADFLPGLIVDRYNDIVSLQVLTQFMDSEGARAAFLPVLSELLEPASIVERVDPRVRELEQLPARASGLVSGMRTSTVIAMNGVRFHYDALAGQKTGAYLDQRENYAAARQYARGEALDVFCYHGAFALHLAENCSRVTGVDISRPALEMADKNAALNAREVEWIEANAFDLMNDYAAARREYDTIVLDPPAFAKSKRNLSAAWRGYKELNLRALKMLRSGGLLVTCSCSYHVSQAEFLGVLLEAAQDAHKTLRILACRTQAEDHPVLLNLPETAYLKCIIAFVSDSF